jgi:hypothetical protein
MASLVLHSANIPECKTLYSSWKWLFKSPLSTEIFRIVAGLVDTLDIKYEAKLNAITALSLDVARAWRNSTVQKKWSRVVCNGSPGGGTEWN